MAQKIQTRFIDDLDGSDAEGTVRFSVDGTNYEIDLSAAHAKALRKAAQKYIAAGRKATPARRPGRGYSRRATNGDPNPTAVREWAKAQGIEVKDRGRVPSDVVVKFQAATSA
jgi:hypothetical protein